MNLRMWNTRSPLERGSSSALMAPVSIRPPLEAASSITVRVNIVSPHLPIGSLCFGLQRLCFQTCVLTGPHLALLSAIPLPKSIKLISTLHAASILKCLCSKTSLAPSPSLLHLSLQDLAYYCIFSGILQSESGFEIAVKNVLLKLQRFQAVVID